ncbi:hypothetical protein D9M71_718280 [compost metagenome]
MYSLLKISPSVASTEMRTVLPRLARSLRCSSIFSMKGCSSGIIFSKLVDGRICVACQNRNTLTSRQMRITTGRLLKIRRSRKVALS